MPLYVAVAVVAVAALGLAFFALMGVHIGNAPVASRVPNSYPPETTPSVTATPTPQPVVTEVSLVGVDSSAWWAASVGAGIIPGVLAGPQIGEPGASIAAMASQFNESEAVAGRQVIIQVGSQDIADGVPNEEISAAVQALWQTVNDRGGRPIASLLPPSDSFPADTLTVNNLIQAAAVAQGVALIDVTTPVAAPDGTWASGYSDDGVEPNASGISAMAEAAAAQLPGLVGVPNVAG